MEDLNKQENMIFSRVTLPGKEKTAPRNGDREIACGMKGGVVFDFNAELQGQEEAASFATSLGLDASNICTRRYTYYRPQSFEELITCLKYTTPTAFEKFVSGKKTTENITSLISSFTRGNLRTTVDEETLTNFGSQIYSILMEDKGPKYYLTRINSFEARIAELESLKASFISSYVGNEPQEDDYNFFAEEQTEDVEIKIDEPKSIEDIINGIVSQRNNVSSEPAPTDPEQI